MTNFTIVETWFDEINNKEEKFYLNHSCLSSLSFGSEEMAWVSEDRTEAEMMYEACVTKHPDADLEMIEWYY